LTHSQKRAYLSVRDLNQQEDFVRKILFSQLFFEIFQNLPKLKEGQLSDIPTNRLLKYILPPKAVRICGLAIKKFLLKDCKEGRSPMLLLLFETLLLFR